MEPKISIEEDYILVEPQEVDYWEILRSFKTLLEMPEYLNKDVIWAFREGSVKTTYEDLYKIKDFAQNNLPKNSKPGKKVAIVVETGLHTAMATEYAKIKIDLPVEFKVFPDLNAAKDWIINK